MTYDFFPLNDKEFEILTTDLLSIAFEARIERFRSGKDRGVDGRFFTYSGKEIILQYKHYLKTGYKGLISKLKKEELAKVKKINPEGYIFVTSLPLSRANKKEIKTIFKPYIKRDNDIFGQEDLNDLLSKNPDIEEKHFKLWMSSTTVFDRIINNAIKGRSEFELEQIRKKSCKYIQTENHKKAIKILNEKHVLLISGEPGIGKTTLAENLCLYFASKDYKFIDIEESLSEAENVYARGKKQIYYFDDFLGSNYFEAIENKKDSHIIKFIERIENDNAKRFILTSRTNILNSGILHSNIFANSNIQQNEFMLTIQKLSDFDRARILYNHIWFSRLPEDYIDELYKDKRYRKIIRHDNYNPRLIEFITDIKKLKFSSSSGYWEHIINTLDNPKDVWDNCFKVQSNAYVRSLVKLTVFNGGSISENELRISFARLNEIEQLKNSSHTEKDFKSTARLAIKSFLNRNRICGEENYTLFNPSITDYVLDEYCNVLENYVSVFKSLYTVKSLKKLLTLEKGGFISQDDSLKLKSMLLEDAFQQGKEFDYLIFITYQFIDDESKKNKILDLLRKIIDSPSQIGEFSKFISLLTRYYDELDLSGYDFLLRCIGDHVLKESEINDFSEFLESNNIESDVLLDKLKSDLESYLIDKLESLTDEIDLSGIITFETGYDGEPDICYDEESIQSELSEMVELFLTDFTSDIINNFDIDIQKIIETIDIDNMVQEFLDSTREPDYDDDYGRSVSSGTQDNIDDLFEKT